MAKSKKVPATEEKLTVLDKSEGDDLDLSEYEDTDIAEALKKMDEWDAARDFEKLVSDEDENS
jgi:hypothetical protein